MTDRRQERRVALREAARQATAQRQAERDGLLPPPGVTTRPCPLEGCHHDDLDDQARAALLERLTQERDGVARWTGRWVHDHQPLSRTDRPYPHDDHRERTTA